MSDKKRIFLTITLFLLLLVASGCGGSADGPEMIGAYPADESQAILLGSLPGRAEVVYHAMIDLEVRSVSDAIDDLQILAYEQDGIITAAHSWHEDRDRYATVTISVPTYRFERLYDDVLDLGKVESESVYGEWEDAWDYGRDDWVMSTLTVNLTERKNVHFPDIPDWYALSTFEQAFSVTAALFRFLLDAAIWLVVVIGPFVLLFWGVRKIWRHFRPNQTKEEEK